MDYDRDKIDECTLALLFLGAFQDVKGVGVSVWKGFDWEAMNRLHEKGYISNPKGKARSVVMTQEGIAKAEEMCKKHFT